MKKSLPLIAILLIVLLAQTRSFSQINIVSTNGYTVNIVVHPKSIITYSSTCTWGYTYNVNLNYHVNFSGPNQPAALYTLQGTLGCGSSTHFFDLPNSPATGSVISQSNVWNNTGNCATASISNMGCMLVTIEISAPGISQRFVTFAAAAAPLPIKLIDFTAEQSQQQVKLNWSTATEINNELFTIERSVDGINWATIKNIAGAGNSSTNLSYSTIDENPVSGAAYYRLKQTDFDGNFTYSDTRVVKFAGTTSVSVYPVPNTGNTVNFRGITETKNTLVTVRDLSGTTVFTTNLNSTTIQMPSLKAGLYVISLKNTLTGEVNNLRYVKI